MVAVGFAVAGECLSEHPRLCGGRLATDQPICADPDLGLVYEWVHAIEDVLTEQGALVGGDSPRDKLYEAAREWVIAYARMTTDQRQTSLKWGSKHLCGGPLVDSGPVCTDEPGPVLPRVIAWVDGVGEAMSDAGWDGTMKTPPDRLRRASYYLGKAARELPLEQVAAFDADCAMRVEASGGATGAGLLSQQAGVWTLRTGETNSVPLVRDSEGAWSVPGASPAPVVIRRQRD